MRAEVSLSVQAVHCIPGRGRNSLRHKLKVFLLTSAIRMRGEGARSVRFIHLLLCSCAGEMERIVVRWLGMGVARR